MRWPRRQASRTRHCFHVCRSELYQHYADIASSTKLPMLLYNNVGKTNVNIGVNTAVKLSKIKNIVKVKESS
ncbi:MAG TPA: hypothetical protein DD633_01060 [Sphaerochaeta sp.]|nr:hypothetical protein [Sphaerochaeta sp.]